MWGYAVIIQPTTAPQETFGSVWRHFLLPQLGEQEDVTGI
jgi:hypothetical protein